ncbi:MAG: cytochrome C, partial [Pseudomonadota bacterium]
MGKRVAGHGILLSIFALALLGGALPLPVAAEEMNCFLCHKHRGLSRVDEYGNFRLFYINEELFESGPHRRNKCKDCHTDIDRIPHQPAKKVDCTQQCHMEEPSGKIKFSHQRIAETLEKSVHGRFAWDGTEKPHQEDFPGCKDCHDQPLYRPLSFYKGERPGVSTRGISRCESCHPKGDFAKSFYEHVTSRLHKTRSPKETVEVCAKCHDDEDFQKRHQLDDVITSY